MLDLSLPLIEEVKIYLQIEDKANKRWVAGQFNVLVIGDPRVALNVQTALERKLIDVGLSHRKYRLNRNYLTSPDL